MKLTLTLLFLIPFSASAQWTIGSRSFTTGPPPTASWTEVQSGANLSCAAGSTCVLNGSNFSATTANTVNAATAYVSSSNSISSIAFSGCSGSAGTWSGGSGAGYTVYNATYGGGMAWAYNLGNGGGCTTLTITLTASETSVWTVVLDEFSRGGGTPAFDTLSSSNTVSTSCTTCSGSAFSSLSGSRDLLLQMIDDGSSTGSPSSPYVWDADQLIAYALNSTQLTAPTWTQSGGGFLSLGAAFK